MPNATTVQNKLFTFNEMMIEDYVQMTSTGIDNVHVHASLHRLT